MFSIPEQFSNATKANFEAQFAIFSTLTNKAFEGVEKIVDLNLTAAKASLEESTAAAKQLLSAKDPQEFFSLAAAQAQPSAEKTIAYGRHLAAITSSTQAEFSKAAETQIAETNRKVISLVEEVTKRASRLGKRRRHPENGHRQRQCRLRAIHETSKQAVEAIEANLASAVNQFTQAAEKVVPRAAAK
jgi:phasin family protein